LASVQVQHRTDDHTHKSKRVARKVEADVARVNAGNSLSQQAKQVVQDTQQHWSQRHRCPLQLAVFHAGVLPEQPCKDIQESRDAGATHTTHINQQFFC
jgi:hypothetical protein